MTEIYLGPVDRDQLQKKGVSEEILARQLNMFQKGTPHPVLVRAATPGDGIHRLPVERQRHFQQMFAQKKEGLKLLKFIPASGAATRMFKTLLKLCHEAGRLDDAYVERQASRGNEDYRFFQQFIAGLKSREFPFIDALTSALAHDDLDFAEIVERQDYRLLIEYLLGENGLNYANLPKALILFHNYMDGPRTSLEEQFREAIEYALSGSNVAHLHFTVSSEFLDAIEAFSDRVRDRLAENGFDFRIEFSIQSPSTDTIAVGLDNRPLVDGNGGLLFRPGGHGALIENLDKLDADVIFIKNIDNVVPDHLKRETLAHQELLAGYLIEIRKRIHTWMKLIAENNISGDTIQEIAGFLLDTFWTCLPENFTVWTVDDQARWMANFFDRPIRVCGMVKNLGEPGGGPFWVSGKHGDVSLQIVEKAQVDCSSSRQKEILDTSTHFNPVILVCSTKNYLGERYSLSEFVDPDTYFISEKSVNGKPLKALELPGLWNGAMANWLTVFVEIPASTFTPVKTVNDLLRKEHQPQEF